MKTTHKIFIAIFSIVFSSINFELSSINLDRFEANKANDPVATSVATSVVGDFVNSLDDKLGGSVGVVKEFFVNFKEIDYDRAKGIVFNLPGLDRELVFLWDFSGAGNIFMPLPHVQGEVRVKQQCDVDTSISADVLKGLGTVFLKNEMYKQGKRINLINKLTSARLTPVHLFIVKIVLLLKKAYQFNDFSRVRPEVLRLLMRLSLVDDINVLDKSKDFSSYLPEVLIDFIKDYVPSIIPIMDEFWKALVDDSVKQLDQLDEQVVSVQGFVFRNKEFVDVVKNNFNNCQLTSFQREIEEFIKKQAYELVDYSEFVGSRPLSGAVSAPFDPANKLAAQKYFNDKELKDFFTELNIPKQFPRVVTFVDKNGEHWVLYFSNDLRVFDTLKFIAISFAQAFKEYASARKTYFTSHLEEAEEYRRLWQQKSDKKAKINSFLSTEQGMRSAQRIQKAIRGVEVTEIHVETIQVKELKANIEKLRKNLDALSDKNQKNLDRLEVFNKYKQENKSAEKNISIIQGLVDASKKQKDIYEADISRIQEKIKGLSKTSLDLISEKKKELEDLQEIIVSKKANCEEVPEDFLTCIQNLKQQIIDIEKDKMQKVSLEEKLQKREKMAEFYIEEAEFLQTEFDANKAEIACISDDVMRMVSVLKNSTLHVGYQVRITDLKEKANHILMENKDAKKLETFKKALMQVDMSNVTDGKKAEIKALEYRVGRFLSNNSQGFVSQVFSGSEEIQELFADVSGDMPEYKKIREDFFRSLKFIIKRSSHVRDNFLVYQYLIRVFFPEITPYLSEITA